jgi:hypothetical protein
MKMRISNMTDQEIDGWIGCNPPTQLDFGLRLIPKDDQLPNILAMLDIDECKTLLTKLREYLEYKGQKV